MPKKAGNLVTLKNENRALIFQYLRPRPTSRAEISKKSGLSKSAVTTITNALIADGQICETGTDAPKTEGAGRKRILLDIVSHYRYAGGISLHRKSVSVCVTGLKSDVIALVSEDIGKFSGWRQVLDWASETLKNLAEKNGVPFEKIIGVGVSAPGPLDYKKGIILTPPDFETFHNCRVAEYLKAKLNMPVMLDNNSTLLAMYDYLKNPEKHDNFMFVVISNGIGSAIVSKGKLYRGVSGYAGEIGHTSLNADGAVCACGNRGCLEQYVNLQKIASDRNFSDYRKMVDQAYLHNEEAVSAMNYIAHYLSTAFVNSVNQFDLDAIVVYGEVTYKGGLLLEKLRKNIKEHSFINKLHGVSIDFSCINPNLEAESVTEALLNAYFNQAL